MPEIEEFRLVTRRRKRCSANRKKENGETSLNSYSKETDDSYRSVDCDVIFRKLHEAENELKNSSYGKNVFRQLQECLSTLNVDGIAEILCYGLGQFSQRRASMYQLALLVSLKRCHNSPVYIYDPVFLSKEIELLRKLDFHVLTVNEEGKRTVDNKVTLVYLPHCSTHLINNFLYANWSRALSKCIIMSNSFSLVVDNQLESHSNKYVDYIAKIQPYAREIPLRNDFLHNEVFNDFAIHIFPEDARKMNRNLQIIRSLIREIRQSSRNGRVKGNNLVEYIMEQARGHRETSEILCKGQNELQYLGETYSCYLSSSRQCKEIHKRYMGKGERSIKETADLVGFKLPHDPK